MNKILSIYLARMKNEIHAQFHENIVTLVDKTNPAKLQIEDIYAVYKGEYAKELEALNVIRKSPLTEKITEQDQVRDGIFRGFSDTVKGCRNHYEAERRVAANQLWSVFLHYGNLSNKTFDAQTAAINDILREFERPELGEAISFLQVEGWRDKLKEENQKFHDLMMARYNEPVGKTTLRMKEARVELDKAYKAVVAQVEVHIMSGKTDAVLNDFVIELNAIIKRFKDILAQEFGRKNNPPKSKIIEVEKLEDNKFKITKT